MQFKLRHLAAGAAIVGALGLGGATLAAAQTDSTTTVPSTAEESPSTTAPPAGTDDSAPAESEQPEGCDHGASARSSSTQSSADEA